MDIYSFSDKLKNSSKEYERAVSILENSFPWQTSVLECDKDTDKKGGDLVVLGDSQQKYVDVKTRETGCKKYWNQGPELALEIWSVCPNHGKLGKAGWTKDKSKITDYVLFLFDISDSKEHFLIPFLPLLKVFEENQEKWMHKYNYGRERIQNSGGWKSSCIFVPACVVLEELNNNL